MKLILDKTSFVIKLVMMLAEGEMSSTRGGNSQLADKIAYWLVEILTPYDKLLLNLLVDNP